METTRGWVGIAWAIAFELLNVLIHEMLHALGLRENPPTSEEINRQVARRCGP